MQGYKKLIDVYKKIMKRTVIKRQEVMTIIYYQIKKKKKIFLNNKLALLTINQDLANVVNKNKDFLLAFDDEILYPIAMMDKDSYYPGIETGYQFTPNKEMKTFQIFKNRTFTQFKDQASVLSKFRY